MLQRSPTYVAALPARDAIAEALRRVLPERAAYAVTRWKNVVRGMFYYDLARRRPALTKRFLRKAAQDALGPGVDVDRHFKPRYDPWDERLCIAPDGDFFRAIRAGRASVVTDTIDTFTETGIRLRSGAEIEADIIVTATGLNAKLFAGLTLETDGRPVDLAESTAYKGMMYSDVPNLASAVGYTNASWTLKCDLTAEHLCRLLNHMADHGYTTVTPRVRDASMPREPLLDLRSGYVQRASGSLPKQGSRAPWRVHQNYLKDLLLLRFGRVAEDELEFSRATAERAASRSDLSPRTVPEASHA
jgi:cation diffusion facilitator CzcD-associated flavoprotein CzcO